MQKTLIFDFDGVIVDSFDEFINVFDELSDEYNYSKIDSDMREYIRNTELKQVLKKLKISIFKLPSFVTQFKYKLKSKVDIIRPFQDIEKTLAKLKETDCNLGILSSNSEENIKVFLKKNNLEKYFDFIYSEEDVFGKDKTLMELLEKFNLNKDNVFYIGDEARDIEACQKIKLKTIAVTWGFNSRELLQKFNPDFLVDDVDEFVKLILSEKNN